MIAQLKQDMQKLSNPSKAKLLSGFFKTGKGEYGEGDVFLGIQVPKQRQIAKKYANLPLKEIQELLNSKVHEHRLTSLLILVEQYEKAENKKAIFDFYLKNTKKINNWDLVDLSAHKIIGVYLLDKDIRLLRKLAKSSNIWERRIAVLSTFQFIKNDKFKETLEIAEMLLNDDHDLIQKATGWMLREVGKRNQAAEESFLKKNYKKMPRTMLRYAIERFSEQKKSFYMAKN